MKKNVLKLLAPVLAALLSVFVFATYIFSEATATTMGEAAEATATIAATNCRYGVGYIYDYRASLAWVPTLNAGWYLNFDPIGASEVKSAEFAPVIKVRQDKENGQRLPTYTVRPPLAYYYLDDNGRVQEGLGFLISRNPGSIWLVGNEVDVDNDAQGNTMPEVYARAYHEIYTFIKNADPTAKVAHASLSMMTEGRMQYLDIVWDTYRQLFGQDMPVDVWNMHLYILSERHPTNLSGYGDGKIALGTDPNLAKWDAVSDPSKCPTPDQPNNDPRPDVYCRSEHDNVRIFQEQLFNMRRWMKEHGQQDKPLIISEYGLLYPYLTFPDGSCDLLRDEFGNCFTPERVSRYLRETMGILDSWTDAELGYPQDGFRMVQQWLWYSVVTNPGWSGGSSNLIVQNFEQFSPGDAAALTAIGQAFRDQATASQSSVNLVGGLANHVIGYVTYPENTGSVQIAASFRNSGMTSIIEPFTVTFYRNAALTEPIGTVTVEPEAFGAITGCSWDGRNNFQVGMIWNDLTIGSHPYWAVIDSSDVIPETSNTDNTTAAGTVKIFPYANFNPIVGTLAKN